MINIAIVDDEAKLSTSLTNLLISLLTKVINSIQTKFQYRVFRTALLFWHRSFGITI